MKRKLFILFVLLANAVGMKAQEAYAVLSEDGTTFTFYYDNIKESREGTTYALNTGIKTTWDNDDVSTITTVVFDSSFVNARPTTTANWFYIFTKLTTIEGIHNLNTSNVTNMSHMFFNCKSLTSLDLSHFNTGNVTDISRMFTSCSSLTSLDLSHFDTHNVTNMYSMFHDCNGLTNLDLSNFDTQNVTDMRYMFLRCSSLKSLDLSSFNTRNVRALNNMFYGCSGLKSLDISHFETGNVTRMADMFNGCSSLTSLDLSHFDTGNVISMRNMFNGCSSLTSLDLSNFDTQNVTDMSGMFSYCYSLSSLIISASLGNSLNDLSSSACSGIGSRTNPCLINQPDGFDFGVDTSGDYFRWKGGYFKLEEALTKKINVTTDLGYITYCSNKSLDFTNVEGMKAYTVVGYDGKVAKLSRMSIVPAETGMLLKADAGNYEIPYTDEDNYVTNMLVGVLENSTLDPTEGSMTNFVLANGNNGLGFYRLKGFGTLAAHRAYLQVPSSMLDNGAKFISMEFDDETTAISGITTQEEDAPYYDLQGVRHEGKPTKQGIYIQNGKKVVVRD